MKESFREIEKEYDKLDKRAAIIKRITRIERTEDVHVVFEDADFSIDTIKKLIRQGEKDAENTL
jgi:NTE family protein